MKPALELSVVIPIGPGDGAWKALLKDLERLQSRAEVLLCFADGSSDRTELEPLGRRLSLRNVHSARGRAIQLNRGASEARGRFLWFLHADSRFTEGTLRGLEKALESERRGEPSLHYFELRYQKDGPVGLMSLTETGVRLRSRLFKMPFGDQGFLVSKETHDRLGGFREDARYGEDHLYVWACHRLGIPVRELPGRILTSARKYRERGWWKTTVQHGYFTWAQALPEMAKFLGKVE